MGQAKNILQQIQRGRISPVYLLHGEENYLIEDTLAEMIEILAPDNMRDFNLDVFSDPAVSVTEVLSMANTYPVMAERRVVVVKDPAFLGSKKKAQPVDVFHQSREMYRSGSLARAAALLARALDLDPEEFAEGGADLSRAVEAFRKDNENDLSSEDLEYLENTAVALAKEIDITSASSTVSDVDQLLEYLEEGPSPTSVIIFAMSTALNGNSKVVKAISRVGTAANFGQLRQSSYVNRDPMYQMVVDRLKEYQKTIAPDAFMELQKKTGKKILGRLYSDTGQIFDELDKLVTFVGTRQRIEKKDVEELVTRTGFDEIFDLTNAIGRRSLPLALANLRSILGRGETPLYVHYMLTRQIRFLLQAKLMLENGDLKPQSAQMSDSEHKRLLSEVGDKLPDSRRFNFLKQHPFPVHLTIQESKNFTVQELIKAMERLLEADIQLKSSALTPELVVEMLVMDLINV
ncbi:DNA polymerase III subunit delta [Candidatus Poribacteria bacterium]